MSDATSSLFASLRNNKGFDEIKRAIDAGANVNAKDNKGFTPLTVAIKCDNNLEVIKLLIDAGADLKAAHKNRYCMHLFAAIEKGDPMIVKTLMDAGAEVKPWSPGDNGTLGLALGLGGANPRIVKMLIDANPNDVREHGHEYVMQAIHLHRQPRIIRMLIEAGADINRANRIVDDDTIVECRYDEGEGCHCDSALTAAISHNDTEAVRTLIEAGVEVNVTDEKRLIPLIEAFLEYSRPEIVKMLIEAGADVNVKCGFPVLFRAIEECNVDVVKMLIDAGADVNARSYEDKTPLFYARKYGDSEIIKLLIDAGAHASL